MKHRLFSLALNILAVCGVFGAEAYIGHTNYCGDAFDAFVVSARDELDDIGSGEEPANEVLPVTTTWDFTVYEGWCDSDDELVSGEVDLKGRIWTLLDSKINPWQTLDGETGCIELYRKNSSCATAPAFHGTVSQVTTTLNPTIAGNGREVTLLASTNGGESFSAVTNYVMAEKKNYTNTLVFDPPLDGGDFGVIFCASNSGTAGHIQLRRLAIEGSSTRPDEPGIYDYTPFENTAGQPSGALSGVVLYLSAAYGYAADATTNAWTTGCGAKNGMVADFGNLDQMNFFAQQAWKAGATIVPMRPLGYQTNDVVIDNVDISPSLASRVTFGGAWADSRLTDCYYGREGEVGYRWTYSCPTGTTAWASYRPDIPVAGEYPVYAWARPGADRVPQLYRVRHAGGVTDVRIDHRQVGGGWVWLGNFWFEKGTGGCVNISNYTPGFDGCAVIADAIRFGNGMGDIARGEAGVSGLERELEASRYWIERQVIDSQGIPAAYDTAGGDRDDDTLAPARMAAQMCRTNGWEGWRRCLVVFHDDTTDAAVLKSLRGRESLARAALCDTIHDLATNYSGSSVFETFAPDAPIAVAATDSGRGRVTVSWKMPPHNASDLQTSAHTGFVIYTSTDGYGFGNPVRIDSSADEDSYAFDGLPTGQPLFFRVCAVNAGGESLPSPVAGVCLSDDGSAADVLVVDDFKSVDATLTPCARYDRIAGAEGPVEVPLVRPRMINSFDYVKEHGNAIAAANHSFNSIDSALVTSAALARSPKVVWCLGRQSVEDGTLSYAEQRLIATFLDNHGALFVSGTNIGRDLGLMGSAADRAFLENYLMSPYVADDAGTNVVVFNANTYFSDLPQIEFNRTNILDGIYAAGRAEVFAPAKGTHAYVAARYGADTDRQGAIIAHVGASTYTDTYRTVVMGFPFETILDETQRNKLMKKVLDAFEEYPYSPKWIGDTAYTAGVGGTVEIAIKTQVDGWPSPVVTLQGTSDSRTGEEVDPAAYTITEDQFRFDAGTAGIGEGTYTFTFNAQNAAGSGMSQEVIISIGNSPVWKTIPNVLVDLDVEDVVQLYQYVSGDPTPDIVLNPDRTAADPATYEFDANEGCLAIGPVSSTVTNIFSFTASNVYGDASIIFTNIVRRLDTDDDGIPDWWERLYFGGSTACNHNLDPDGDLFNNYEEYVAGTDPKDGSSYLTLGIGFGAAGEIQLYWPSATGRVYSVLAAPSPSGDFSVLEGDIEPDPPRNTYTIPTPLDAAGFFRLRVTCPGY